MADIQADGDVHLRGVVLSLMAGNVIGPMGALPRMMPALCQRLAQELLSACGGRGFLA